MKEIPEGFVKMQQELTFKTEQIKIWEDNILYFLVRDFYIFYTKNKKFGKDEFVELHFYCRPKDESNITYRMGCYAQAAFNFFKKDHFTGKHRIHSVPANFPECIHVEPQAIKE